MAISPVQFVFTFLIVLLFSGGCREKAVNEKLSAKIDSLEQLSGGILGVASLDLANDVEFRHRADQPFAMASVYKFPIGIGVLQLVSEEKIDLKDSVLVGMEARRWGYSPLTSEITENGPVFQT